MLIGKDAEIAPLRIDGIPDDDWQGMYHIAARRAVEAENRIRYLTAELAAYRGRDTRVCLHCGRAQEETT